MTKPRPIIEGTTYLLTRRCARREFLLTPSKEVAQIFTYCLGVAAERHGMVIHAVCVLSNHYHLVATDPKGNLPKFMQWMNEFIAKALNAHYGRSESFWAPGSYNAVKLVEADDVARKIVYTLNNPVAAGLVERHEHWPGLCTDPESMLGAQWTVERPTIYFGRRSKLPKYATVTFAALPEVDERRFVRDVREMLTVKEIAEGEGKPFVGREAIVAQCPTDTPKEEPKRGFKPRLACGDRRRRAEELEKLRTFEVAYREARLRLLAKEEDVVFPHGTYGLRSLASVAVAPG